MFCCNSLVICTRTNNTYNSNDGTTTTRGNKVSTINTMTLFCFVIQYFTEYESDNTLTPRVFPSSFFLTISEKMSRQSMRHRIDCKQDCRGLPKTADSDSTAEGLFCYDHTTNYEQTRLGPSLCLWTSTSLVFVSQFAQHRQHKNDHEL